jgi:DNA replication regulator DPB11
MVGLNFSSACNYTRSNSCNLGQSPLQGVLLCCSGLPRLTSDTIQQAARDMGAATTLDLTGQVTHLVVNGNSSTAKYKYVAKARPEVKVILESFIETARAIWLTGGKPDIKALEATHTAPALLGVHISLTGFSNGESTLPLAHILGS